MEKTLIDYFVTLVKIDSESRNEYNIAMKIKADLEELGAEVQFDNANEQTGGNIGNLRAFIPGNPENSDVEPIMFCAHLDTVVPGKNIQPQIRDGVIYSDGTTVLGADDKSGIAQIIWGIKSVIESGNTYPPIELLFTVCEEVGLLGAKNCDFKPFKAKRCFAFDTHNVGSIMNGAPSQNNISVTIHGKKAHAGVEPEKGINAILIASQAIADIPLGRIDEETTANIGIIKGGEATNIVPDTVTLKGEVRSHSIEKLGEITDKICSVFRAKASSHQINGKQASVDIKVTKNYEAFYVDETDELLKRAQRISEELNLSSKPYKGGGGSDANILNIYGIKSIVIGTGMEKVHTTEEEISVDALTKGALWVEKWLGAESNEQ